MKTDDSALWVACLSFLPLSEGVAAELARAEEAAGAETEVALHYREESLF